MVDGNSVVVRLVGAGECVIGLTDSDDVRAGVRQNLPVASVPRFEERFLIFSTITILPDAPRRDLAQKLKDYIRRKETLRQMIDLGALSGITPPESLHALRMDWSQPAGVESMNEILRRIFLRS